MASRLVPASKEGNELNVSRNPVAPRFFLTMGIPLILGRDFTTADGQEAPRVAVVSESFARKYFPNEDPLAKQIRFKDGKAREHITVVGVVKGVKAQSLREREPVPKMYILSLRLPLIFLGK